MKKLLFYILILNFTSLTYSCSVLNSTNTYKNSNDSVKVVYKYIYTEPLYIYTPYNPYSVYNYYGNPYSYYNSPNHPRKQIYNKPNGYTKPKTIYKHRK